ncbi:MAG: AMIN domain-containing protein [Gemmatimonadaceae bacterium]|nr:AMIN domain-containing protein [Gemmatimonadaceae bacterium]
MRRVCSLVAITTVALFGSSREAHAGRPAVAIEAASSITALSIVPGTGRADVIVSVSGPVEVQDFTVPSPHRIVLDISGARLAPFARAYDRIARAGISNVRLAQYRSDVVRIVLDLDRERDYAVTREGNTVRISLTAEERFAAWHSSGQMLAEAVAEVAAERPAATPKSDTTVVEKAGEVVTSPPARDIEEAATQNVRPEPRIDAAAPQAQQPRITVTYAGADIRDVLAAFATFSQRTIVVGKDVSGTITAEIKDQPWDVALKALLEAQGLAAIEEASGIITVDSYKNILEKQASEPVATQMVNINYVSATSLQPTVQGLLYKDCAPGTSQGTGGAQGGGGVGGVPAGCIVRGTVAADSATNSLIITEVASRLPNLLSYVRGLDVRTPQVALKAKIISVQRTSIEQLGLSYDIGSANTFLNTLLPRIPEGATTPGQFESRVELGGDAIAGVANATRKYKSGSALNLIFSTALGKYSLTSFLDALRESQLSDVQAEPSVVTLDNREARLTVGQETPVRVIDAGSLGQIGTPARANVQFRETGIILKVTPHITSNRQIRMKMEAEQSELRIVGGDLGFIIDKRNAQTQLLVNDGETAVIAGLVQTQVVKNRAGIPFLSDLPLIGRFFSQSDSREEKKDLLIMITPTIINDGDPVRPPSGSK